MIFALIGVPFIAGILAFLIRHDGPRRALFISAAVIHASLSAAVWFFPPEGVKAGKWFCVDPLGKLFLSVISLLFLAASIYGTAYLRREGHGGRKDIEEGFIFSDAPEAVFTGCLLIFLSAMTLVTVSRHMGVLWVAMETTTLVSAPLIYFHRHHRSLEAAWKYLLICSVGIALALIGNLFLAVSVNNAPEGYTPLLLGDMIKQGAGLNVPRLKVAFIFLIVGYGTKMGLAPMHTWLPDAHSEAPSVVSALLSGALLNCAFLGILRAHQVSCAAGQAEFSGQLLMVFGIVSMAFAAVFIAGQTDFKRMLAYSSVEHMGIMALGAGIGGGAVFGAMFHVINHSLIKAVLFFTAGNILAVYRSKNIRDIRGAVKVIPYSGVLWIAGFLAVTGTPPSGIFLSEFIILKGALDSGHIFFAAAYIILLSVIFISMANIVLNMAQGDPSEEFSRGKVRESFMLTAPGSILCLIALILGVYMPGALQRVLEQAARVLGGI
ncbi:MAG: proton-conducting transporter membrane subunit [Candidatus Omnitrophota bacterium]